MKTVIKNSAQDPCPPLSLTPRFSEVDHPQRWLSSCFNSFPAIRLNPSISDQIRVTFLTGSRSTPVQVSPTQSNLVQPNPTTPPLPVKKSVKKRSSFWLFLTT